MRTDFEMNQTVMEPIRPKSKFNKHQTCSFIMGRGVYFPQKKEKEEEFIRAEIGNNPLSLEDEHWKSTLFRLKSGAKHKIAF